MADMLKAMGYCARVTRKGPVRHYVEVHDKTENETRSILPLTRIWWAA